MNDTEVIEQLRIHGRLGEAFFVLLERACAEDETFLWTCCGFRHPHERSAEPMRVDVAAASASCGVCGKSWALFEIAEQLHGPGIRLSEFREHVRSVALRPAVEVNGHEGDRGTATTAEEASAPEVQQSAPDLPIPDEREELQATPAAAPSDAAPPCAGERHGILEELARANVSHRVPPHDIEAEIAVLGSLLLLHAPTWERAEGNAEILVKVRALLTPADFFKGPHAELYAAICRMHDAGQAIDIVLVREDLQKRGVLEKAGGTSFLSVVIASVPTAVNAEHYAKIVKDLAQRRRIITAAWLAERAAFSGDERSITAALEQVQGARLDVAPANVERGEHWGFEELMKAQFPPPNLFWDDWLAGPSVNIAFGPSGAGKSWLVWALLLGLAMPIEGELLGKTIIKATTPALLVLGSEDPPRRAQDRFGKLLRSSPIPDIAYGDVPLTVKRPPASIGGLQSEKGQKWLRQVLKETGAKVLGLDTIGSLLTLKLSDGVEVMSWLRFLHHLRDHDGISTIMNAHTRKMGSDAKKAGTGTTIDDLFGAQEWRAQSDGLVMFSTEGEPEEGKCWISRAKDKDIGGNPPKVLTKLDKATGRFEVLAGNEGTSSGSYTPSRGADGTRGPGRPPKLSVDVVREMLQQLQTVPVKDIPRRLGCGQSTWWHAVKDIQAALLREGALRISPDGKGSYTWQWIGPEQAS